MESPRSLSSSSASTIPSVLENSDSDKDHSKSDPGNCGEEEFESEGDHESPVVAPANLSSSSDKYDSDEFEDHHEVSGTVERVEVGSSEGDAENDYDLESFEREDEASSEQKSAVVEPDFECEHQDVVAGKLQQFQDVKVNDERHPLEAEELVDATERELEPQLGSWCSKKMQDLRAAIFKVEDNQSRIKRTPTNIPAGAVENLINRATASRQHHRPRLNRNISVPSSRSKIQVPASLMQRAQTQQWITKLSSEHISTVRRPNTPTQDIHSTSTRSVAPTFCSVKRENLLGKLATIQLSETCKRWAVSESGGISLATLDFIQSMTMKQRQIYCSSDSTDEPGGKMLHRVAMTARLQLEDSIALRHQADELLGRVSET